MRNCLFELAVGHSLVSWRILSVSPTKLSGVLRIDTDVTKPGNLNFKFISCAAVNEYQDQRGMHSRE